MLTREQIEYAKNIIRNERQKTFELPFEIISEREVLDAYLSRDNRGYLKPNTVYDATPLNVLKAMAKNKYKINLSTQSFNFNTLDLEKTYYVLNCVENLNGHYDSLFKRANMSDCDYLIDFMLKNNMVSKDILPQELKKAAQNNNYKSIKAILKFIN